MNNKSQIGSLQETAIDTRAFTKYNFNAPDFTSLETEIARWKATAEEEAAVGTGVEQEFVAQGKCTGEPSLALKAGESRRTTSPSAPPVFLRFTEGKRVILL
ncbi:uncharacterized protein [Pyrus communis]|uniref:uncharacterized protein isoform X2 n=1 Tax=Pyrus communis TaxID=23211 RepID=UPI0035C0D623